MGFLSQAERVRAKSRLRTGPVTARGWLFAVALVSTAVAAFASANNLLFLILGAMLSALMISNLVGRLSLAGLELDFRLSEHISARRKFPARIVVRNTKRWIPSFSVWLAGIGDSVFSPLYFPVLQGGAVLDQFVDVEFARRGVHREDGFRFSTAFPFGFLERRTQVRLRREILVYPCMNPQSGFDEILSDIGGEASAHYRGRGHDFYRIRPYEPFESAKHVDWNATARTGALQVREFAREQEPFVEILFDADAPESQRPWFEHAIECCTFLSWHLAQREARLRFVSQDFSAIVPAAGDTYTVLKYLALVQPLQGGSQPGPMEDNAYHIVFTVSPQRYIRTAWSFAHFITPENLPAPAVQ